MLSIGAPQKEQDFESQGIICPHSSHFIIEELQGAPQCGQLTDDGGTPPPHSSHFNGITTGAPHLGQDIALSDTIFPHSEHFIKAINDC